MIVPGVRKMPTAMTWPTTSAVAAGRPSSRGRFVPRHQNDGAHGELERARSARSEDAAGGVHGLTEARRSQVPGIGRIRAVAHQHVGIARVVLHADAEDVRDVEQVEHFHHRLDAHAVPGERPGHAQVERRKPVAESHVVADERQRLAVDAACGIQIGQRPIQIGSGLERAAAGVALERRNARLRRPASGCPSARRTRASGAAPREDRPAHAPTPPA